MAVVPLALTIDQCRNIPRDARVGFTHAHRTLTKMRHDIDPAVFESVDLTDGQHFDWRGFTWQKHLKLVVCVGWDLCVFVV